MENQSPQQQVVTKAAKQVRKRKPDGPSNRGCPHGRRKRQCRDCGGSNICEHGKQKSRCADCGGSGICPHKRRKERCQECLAERKGGAAPNASALPVKKRRIAPSIQGKLRGTRGRVVFEGVVKGRGDDSGRRVSQGALVPHAVKLEGGLAVPCDVFNEHLAGGSSSSSVSQALAEHVVKLEGGLALPCDIFNKHLAGSGSGGASSASHALDALLVGRTKCEVGRTQCEVGRTQCEEVGRTQCEERQRPGGLAGEHGHEATRPVIFRRAGGLVRPRPAPAHKARCRVWVWGRGGMGLAGQREHEVASGQRSTGGSRAGAPARGCFSMFLTLPRARSGKTGCIGGRKDSMARGRSH